MTRTADLRRELLPECPRLHTEPQYLVRLDDRACDLCLDRLRADLVSLIEPGGLLDDLEATRARWTVRPKQVSGGAAKRETPVPFDERVSHVLEALSAALLNAALTAWAPRDVSVHQIGRGSVHDLAVYLLERLSWLQAKDSAPDLLDPIRSAIADARRVVDVPHARQYLGQCGADMGENFNHDGCAEQLWARHGQTSIECPNCGATWDVYERQVYGFAAVDDLLMTLWAMAKRPTSELLFGEPVPIKTLEKWRARRRIHPVEPMHGPWREGEVGPAHVFRVGDVRRVVAASRLIRAERARRAEAGGNG